jgi:hypothetical protein
MLGSADWRKRVLGATAGPGRRVLHLQCSTRGIRHVAAIKFGPLPLPLRGTSY